MSTDEQLLTLVNELKVSPSQEGLAAAIKVAKRSGKTIYIEWSLGSGRWAIEDVVDVTPLHQSYHEPLWFSIDGMSYPISYSWHTFSQLRHCHAAYHLEETDGSL